MIKVIHIKTLEELLPLLTEQEYRPDLDRNRSSYVYRGVSDDSFKMYTSLGRNCKGLQQQLEPAILENFAKYAINDEPSIEKSVWRQMILGQHYGLPTRLLDWTQSALVGLNFAMTEEDLQDMDKHDCAVWRINMSEMPKKLNYFEASIRTLLKDYMQRGKVDVFITYEDYTEESFLLKYNKDMAKAYLTYLSEMAEEFGIENDVRVVRVILCVSAVRVGVAIVHAPVALPLSREIHSLLRVVVST